MQAKGLMLTSLFALLTACGGSGETQSTPVLTQPTKPTAKLTVDLQYQAYECDITSPISDADIILHRQDGSILSQSKSGDDGKINLDWPAEAKHITIATDVDGETQVRTLTEVVASDLGIFKFTKASLDNSCSCETFTFDTNEVNAVYSGFNVFIDSSPTVTQTYCKNNGIYSPVNITLMPSQAGVTGFAATLDLNDKESSQTILISSDLFGNSNNAGVLLTATISPFQPFNNRFRTFSETEYGRVNWLGWQFEPQVFPSLYTNNFVSTSFSENMGGNQYGDLFYASGTRKRVIDANATQNLDLPQNQNQLLEQTNLILIAMDSGGASEYDFSTIGTGKTLLSVEVGERGSALWSVEAPLSGSMPELVLPDAIEAKFEQMANPMMTISIYGYNTHNPSQFNEYRKQRAVISRDASKVRSSFFDNYVYELIDVTLSL
jgi:hypothetical protein